MSAPQTAKQINSPFLGEFAVLSDRTPAFDIDGIVSKIRLLEQKVNLYEHFLHEIAAWDEGDFDSSFDEPRSAAIARTALAQFKIVKKP